MLQRGSPCQDPAGNRTTRRPPDHLKETQTAVVWLCLPYIRSDKNHLAGQGTAEGGRRQGRQEEMGRQHQGIDKPGVRQVQEGSGERKWRKVVVKSLVVSQRPSRLRN